MTRQTFFIFHQKKAIKNCDKYFLFCLRCSFQLKKLFEVKHKIWLGDESVEIETS